MLILLAGPGGDPWPEAAAALLRDGHLPIDAGRVEAALRAGGPLGAIARRLASHCDAALLAEAPALAVTCSALRRPVYRAAALVPPADRPRPAPAAPPGWLLEAALRSLDR
jgi:hypothetical protein